MADVDLLIGVFIRSKIMVNQLSPMNWLFSSLQTCKNHGGIAYILVYKWNILSMSTWELWVRDSFNFIVHIIIILTLLTSIVLFNVTIVCIANIVC